MLAVPVLGGCSRTDREAQEAYRQKGIQNMQEGDYKAAEENFQKALDESLGEIGDVEKRWHSLKTGIWRMPSTPTIP